MGNVQAYWPQISASTNIAYSIFQNSFPQHEILFSGNCHSRKDPINPCSPGGGVEEREVSVMSRQIIEKLGAGKHSQ
jgi:hypothetical protein